MGGRLPVVGLMDARVLVRRVLHEGEPAVRGKRPQGSDRRRGERGMFGQLASVLRGLAGTPALPWEEAWLRGLRHCKPTTPRLQTRSNLPFSCQLWLRLVIARGQAIRAPRSLTCGALVPPSHPHPHPPTFLKAESPFESRRASLHVISAGCWCTWKQDELNTSPGRHSRVPGVCVGGEHRRPHHEEQHRQVAT